jgi:hypothetical protein
MTEIGKAGSGYQAHIAESNHRNTHDGKTSPQE